MLLSTPPQKKKERKKERKMGKAILHIQFLIYSIWNTVRYHRRNEIKFDDIILILNHIYFSASLWKKKYVINYIYLRDGWCVQRVNPRITAQINAHLSWSVNVFSSKYILISLFCTKRNEICVIFTGVQKYFFFFRK